MKIQIIGYSGSGKSTFAKRLAEYYNTPLLYLDSVHFKENWEENDREVFSNKVKEVVELDSWIIEGNYFSIVPERFDKCDIIFYFKFNRFKCLYGALRRYFKYRKQERESMAKGCVEKFDFEFFKWIMHDGRTKKNKRKYQSAVSNCSNVYVFTKRRQVNKYLGSLGIKIK